MNVLKKHTTSLCPTCYQEIPAQIIERNNSVFMVKTCSDHGSFEQVIERDVWMYKQLMNVDSLAQCVPFEYTMIPITHSCNLSCPVCFLPNRNTPDLTFEDIKNIVTEFPGNRIRLSGGEPTMRKDLPEIISFINSIGKIPSVSTNGIAFADRQYVKCLKHAGLRYIHLSFNSFDNEGLTKINGAPLKRIKQKALRNLRAENMNIRLSVMLQKNVNENQLRKIFRLCMRHTPQVCSLRIRTVVPSGRYTPDLEQLYLSDLAALFSKTIGVSKKNIVRHSNTHMKGKHLPCSLTLDLERLLLSDFRGGANKNQLLRGVRMWMYLIPRIGIRNVIYMIINKLKKKSKLFNFIVFIRSWPHTGSIDLEEIKRCSSAHYVTAPAGMYPFCKAVTLNERTILL